MNSNLLLHECRYVLSAFCLAMCSNPKPFGLTGKRFDRLTADELVAQMPNPNTSIIFADGDDSHQQGEMAPTDAIIPLGQPSTTEELTKNNVWQNGRNVCKRSPCCNKSNCQRQPCKRNTVDKKRKV